MSFQIVVNGAIFTTQAYGGISNIFRAVLPRICQQDPSIKMTLFIDAKARATSFPQHERILTIKMPTWLEDNGVRLGPATLPISKNTYKKMRIGMTRGKILHPTYFDLIPGWQGPIAITLYDMIYEKWPDWFQNTEWVVHLKEEAIRRADNIFCISESTRQDLLAYYKGIDAKKTIVIHLCHDPIFTPRSEFLVEKVDLPFILYVGSRPHRKGADDLLRAYSNWSRKDEIRLLFVGQPWTLSEQQRIHDLGLDRQVILKSEVSDDGLCDLYNQAQAFVYPSYYEGFGIPLLEAMACGCPIAASRIPASVEVAGKNPCFFECGDQEGLLSAMEQAVNISRQDRRIQAGMKWAQKYSWDETAREMLNAYRLLI